VVKCRIRHGAASAIASYTVYSRHRAPSGARYGCPPVEIVLPAGKRLSDHQFTCGEPGDLTISGRVLLPDGAPAGGAEVALMQLPLKTTTDAQGAFTLEGIGENDNYSVQATLQGYSAAAQFQAKGGDDDITLQLRPLVQLAGRVLDAASGVPIQGAKIELQQYTNGLQVPVNTKSAADGGFAFENRSMGSFNIHTTAPGYADNSHSFHISENTEIPAMVIKLTPPVRVAGVVLDPSGVPLAGATLEAAQGRIRTISNTDGSFDLHGLESGVATALKVSHTDHGRITLEVVPGSPGTEDLTITMPVPPTLEVIATLDGAPLPSYDVNGMSMVPSGNSFYTRANSPDGRVTAREVSAGTWNINIRHDGGGGTEINQVVEFSGGQVTTVTAAFQTGTSSLQGKFSSPFGPSGMQRHAHLKNLDEGRTGYPVHIEPDNYSVENIAPGNYVLIIFGGETGFQRIQRLVRIAEGEAKEFDIILDGSASVAFTRSGNLEENFIVTLTNSENAPDPAELERSGSLTPTDSDNYTLPIPAGASTGSLSGLAPGDYWLYAGPMSRMVVPPGGTAPEPVYQSVQIAPGDANEFEVGG
jgi:hypothetical protein